MWLQITRLRPKLKNLFQYTVLNKAEWSIVKGKIYTMYISSADLKTSILFTFAFVLRFHFFYRVVKEACQRFRWNLWHFVGGLLNITDDKWNDLNCCIFRPHISVMCQGVQRARLQQHLRNVRNLWKLNSLFAWCAELWSHKRTCRFDYLQFLFTLKFPRFLWRWRQSLSLIIMIKDPNLSKAHLFLSSLSRFMENPL